MCFFPISAQSWSLFVFFFTAPMFRQHGQLYEENMDVDSDERNPDTEDDGRNFIGKNRKVTFLLY